ncbi:lysophospholipid acyltransferase family protein [Sphingomonas sp. S2-65]|uniref:lysophospholipid acyltransferase family protein n=1 Tax=Sphingomonas sp. S2-65 TaxID=2903960 RepID=UPI001F2A7404|nr:lysophospholipid acyltransferase family protein [Sphingomonas sp. S2-65]UYY57966.1 1-acyl-sn-glycerol-3-phosphate acyltransferase [Sphingomonas sp. S2-65]
MASPSTASPDPRRAAAADGHRITLTFAERARMWRRVGLLLLAVLTHVPVHGAWRLFRLPSPWPRRFLGRVARIVGARVETIGTPRGRDVFYVSNHVSWIDILALGGASGTAFVAKAEIGAAPVVGWLAGLNRTVYVNRENRMGVAGQIEQLRAALDGNWAITVFPEGTTTDGKSLLPFKTPMLRVLEPPPPDVMVQPVLLDYGAAGEDIGWVGEESGLDNARRVLARRGSFPLRVHFLEPFDPADFPGRKAIAAESRRRIEAALTAALGHAPRPFAYVEQARSNPPPSEEKSV